ncbi:MAG TPA: hypothetical protein VHR43_11340 [Gemmatimonadales bacterium]|jgi:hypothetical protein|nr:hypothetical protein [Gemmatimonadales bacterium]
MRARYRSVTWRGQSFRFQYLPPDREGTGPLWAVSREREFIGMMPCPTEIPTKEFDTRAYQWLRELLEGARRL